MKKYLQKLVSLAMYRLVSDKNWQQPGDYGFETLAEFKQGILERAAKTVGPILSQAALHRAPSETLSRDVVLEWPLCRVYEIDASSNDVSVTLPSHHGDRVSVYGSFNDKNLAPDLDRPAIAIKAFEGRAGPAIVTFIRSDDSKNAVSIGSRTLDSQHELVTLFSGEDGWVELSGGGSGGGSVLNIPVGGHGFGDNTGWSVVGRTRFTDNDYVVATSSVELVAECEVSPATVPGEVALYDVTGGTSTLIGVVQDVTSDSPTEVTITIPDSASPATDRILELRARVNGGKVDDRCIVWASYISIRQV